MSDYPDIDAIELDLSLTEAQRSRIMTKLAQGGFPGPSVPSALWLKFARAELAETAVEVEGQVRSP